MKKHTDASEESVLYLDFHTHILPGLDDGSRSGAQSVQMLESMKKQKIGHIVATPHYYASIHSPEDFFEGRAASWERLKKEPLCSDFDIRLGAEVQYYEGISRLEEPERFCIEGTKLFLLEMPFVAWNERILADVCNLSENPSLHVVIAHIERYLKIQSKRFIAELMDMDVLIQCNAEFFISRLTRCKALRMMKQGQIQVIGSDCHNMSSRIPNVGMAMGIIEKHIGALQLQEFIKEEKEILRIEGE